MTAQAPARDRATVAQLSAFDETIDARTPLEFAEDHMPGALNLPVLSNQERARVGTLYKQVSTFQARKVGAALVSSNIGRHLDTALADKPRGWRPLLYCWRGGKRSAAFTHVLREIGWDACQLDGGYRAFRRHVVAELPALAQRLQWRVVCGLTGSGKSRLLASLRRLGAQVLDLEKLAAHRGSVLGALPDIPQPPQKMFESQMWDALRRFDPGSPVYVESESKRIGVLHVPQELMERMWASPCLVVDTSAATRVELLKAEYEHFVQQPALLSPLLDCLVPLHGRALIERWKAQASAGEWNAFVQDLLMRHYDPAYTRSIVSHYPGLPHARHVAVEAATEPGFEQAANEVLKASAAPTVQPA